MLRLKRWLVAGLADQAWGPEQRTQHVKLGGLQLRHFADGLSEQDLDAAVSALR